MNLLHLLSLRKASVNAQDIDKTSKPICDETIFMVLHCMSNNALLSTSGVQQKLWHSERCDSGPDKKPFLQQDSVAWKFELLIDQKSCGSDQNFCSCMHFQSGQKIARWVATQVDD